MIPAYEYSLEDWQKFLKENKEPAFRAKQIIEWLYVKKAEKFDDMSNLSKKLREILKGNFSISSLTLAERLESKQDAGTQKLLFKTTDGHSVESVLIPNSKDQHTLCISSQAGCAFGCTFCATGQMGFFRNLSVAEILEQLAGAERFADVSNIVFMGMGEPLANPNFWPTLEKLTSEKYFNMASRSITVSTVGLPDGIRKMADYKQIKLAWSMHSSIDSVRKKIFPVLEKNYSFKDVQKAFYDYQEATGKKRFTIEYLLMKDLNDTEEEARNILEMGRDMYFHLNVIPYNSHPYARFEAPEKADTKRFMDYFKNASFDVTLRFSRGKDIQGACGQLAAKSK